MINHSVNKYSLLHPTITPEYFNVTRSSDPTVKSLYISSDDKHDPYVVNETSDNILQLVFQGREVKYLNPNPYYHVCFATDQQEKLNQPNFIATHLVRLAYLSSYGMLATDAMYGDVIIFGSYNFSKKIIDNKSHSVPYEVVEQVLRINEIRSKFKKTLSQI